MAIRRISICLIAFVFGFLSFHETYSQQSAKKILFKAVHDTYNKGLSSYVISYSSLGSGGDTLSNIYKVLEINKKNDFSFNSFHQDSITEVYYKDIILQANQNNKTYRIGNINEEDARYEFDQIYLPFVDKEFIDHFKSDSVTIVKVFEDKSKYVVKINSFEQDDFDSLSYIVDISKYTNIIMEYTIQAKVAGLPIYENWRLISVRYSQNDEDSVKLNRDIFFNFIKSYKPFCESADNRQSYDSENKMSRTELEGTLPLLQFLSLDGDTLILKDINSNYYLFDFWYRSCMPCIKSIPMLKALHLKYDEKYLKILSINSVDKSNELITRFINDNQIPYTIYTGTVERGKKFNSIHSYPTFILFDSNFNVIKTFEGYSDNLLDQIETLIAPKN